MEVVEFPLSRKKRFLYIGLLLSIICLGVFLVYISSVPGITFDSIMPLVYGATILIISIFLAVQFFPWITKYKIGLRVDERGITDYSNTSAIGNISWRDIVRIETIQEANIQMILVFVRNPDAYLSRVNKITRMGLEMNIDKYDTPIFITATSLKCNFSELENAVRGWFIQMS